jgi:hypothetical protein
MYGARAHKKIGTKPMTPPSSSDRMRKQLEELEREVAQGLTRLRRQWAIVERLEDGGRDSTEARKLLRGLERMQAENVRKRLELSIAVLVHPAEQTRREQARGKTVALLDTLARLERDINRGRQILEQQRALVFDLELRGLRSVAARALLQTFEHSQALRLAQRASVQRRLDPKRDSGEPPAAGDHGARHLRDPSQQ